MVRTHIGVKWPNIETTPLTGTIAYEVMTKRSIPGPGVYDREHPSFAPPIHDCFELGGIPHGPDVDEKHGPLHSSGVGRAARREV